MRTFHDNLRNPQRISYAPCGAADTSIEPVEGKQIIVIRVRAAPLRNRPVYIKGNNYAGTYVRRHTGDYLCNKQEVDRMMREASTVAADSTILSHLRWDDLDPEALARYRQLHQNANPTSPRNRHDDRRFLGSIGGYSRDQETGKEGVTVAGLLMFGTDEAILAWRSRHLIDYQLAPAEPDSQIGWADRIVWEGNLLGAFETIYPRLTADLPRPFRLVEGRRVDDSPVHVALREALVNLLVHADYAETQSSLIRRSRTEYFFRNPGSSRVPEVDLIAGYRSDPRNPALVRMFRLIGLAEEAGTGLARIRQAWRELGYRAPRIDAGTERYEFALSLHHVHMLSDDDRAWLSSLRQDLGEPEQLALVLAKHEGEVDNLKLRNLTGQHPADVTKVLGGLRDRGLLQMIGGGRGARYQLGDLALAAPAEIATPASMRSPNAASESAAVQLSLLEQVEAADSNSSHEGAEPAGKGTELAAKGAEFTGKGTELTATSAELTAEGKWRELQNIARVVRDRQHVPLDTLEDVVVKLCQAAPLGLHELSELLGREPAYLRRVLRALTASGRLEFAYPKQASHPRQKYVAQRSP